MPRTPRPRRRPEPPRTPLALEAARYLEWLAASNYSPETVKARRVHLDAFLRWCAERALADPAEITRPILESYQRSLYHHRKADGTPLSFRSQHARLVPLRGWFRWLARQHRILHNPASELELPRLDHRLPKHVLSAREAEQVLAQAAGGGLLSLRDRAMLETLYSTGLRRAELAALKLYDLDAERGTLFLRQGKGKKDRMIPIGARALEWIAKYLEQARPRLAAAPDDGTLFLTSAGEPFAKDHLSALVAGYVDAAALGKRGSCHLFRHTMATLMLEGGADIRFIQQMLGHADLSTTQIYTQVSIRQLKQIHSATHPASAAPARPALPEDNEDRE